MLSNFLRKATMALEFSTGLVMVLNGIINSNYYASVTGMFLVFDASTRMDKNNDIGPNAF